MRATLRRVVLVALALAVGSAGWLEPGAVARPAPAFAAAEPGPAVKQAFDLLMDRFVIPPSSADVLAGGWDGALTGLRAAGLEPLPAGRPALSGVREADWQAFSLAYADLLDGLAGRLEPARLDRAIIRGMAVAMHSSHTLYLEQGNASLASGRYGGIGMRMNAVRGVVEVFDGSPAATAGLRIGDRLLAVDGAPVEGLKVSAAAELVRGPVGTSVELTLERAGMAEPQVIAVTRAEITAPWNSWRMLDDGVGYLRLNWMAPPDGSLQAALEALGAAGPRALILDLRGNRGGSSDTLRQAASSLVPRGPILQSLNRAGERRTLSVTGTTWGRSVPMVVLVDSESRSSAELLASTLRENGVATLVGGKTAGEVAAGAEIPLVDGSALVVTVALLTSGQGRVLEGAGLEPDQVVELDLEALRAGRDTQLEAAREALRQKAP